MSAMSTTPEDLAEMELSTRRTRAEAAKLEAEALKLDAETHKFTAERRKAELEGRKAELEAEALHRWRYVAIPVGMAAVIGVAGGFVGGFINKQAAPASAPQIIVVPAAPTPAK